MNAVVDSSKIGPCKNIIHDGVVHSALRLLHTVPLERVLGDGSVEVLEKDLCNKGVGASKKSDPATRLSRFSCKMPIWQGAGPEVTLWLLISSWCKGGGAGEPTKESMQNGSSSFLARPEAATKYPGWMWGRALSAFSAQPQIKHNHALDNSRRLFETSSQNAKKSKTKNLSVGYDPIH